MPVFVLQYSAYNEKSYRECGPVLHNCWSADLVASHGGSVDLKSRRYDRFVHVRTQPCLGRILRGVAQHSDARDIVTVRKLLGEDHGVWITLGICEVVDDVVVA